MGGFPQTHHQSITTFEVPRLPPLVAYKILPHQVPLVYRALQDAVRVMGYEDFDAAKLMTKSSQTSSQVLFATHDIEGTLAPQEAILVSFGQGSRIRLYHASRPVSDYGANWFQWAESIAGRLGLEKVNLPSTIFLEDIGWMLRAHASRALGMQEHIGDTHLIHRVERFFADVVFVVRKAVKAERGARWKAKNAMAT